MEKRYNFKKGEMQQMREMANSINLILKNTPIKKISYEAKNKSENNQNDSTATITIERCGTNPVIFEYKEK